MGTELSPGFEWRRPTVDDAASILRIIATHNTQVLGVADCTLADVRDELVAPGFDLRADAWLVADRSGADVAYGWACRNGESAIVDADVFAGDDVADWLWARVLDRARELGAEAGHREVSVDVGIYDGDDIQAARARARGFVPATTFQRMRIDHDVPPGAPAVPSGVVVRVGPGDERLRRHGHDVWRRAFADHFGFVDAPFGEWHGHIDAAATTDWAQLRVAYLDGEPAAMVRGNDQFVEDQDCGYIATVAVVPEARGRGLAKLLLLQAFVDDFGRGRRGTVLHVDANNVTPAVGLYMGVGMRPVLRIDVWRAALASGHAAADEIRGAEPPAVRE